MSFESVLEAVRDRVIPDDEEVAELETVVADLTDRAEAAIADLPVEADTSLVGSTARGTWLSGDRDVDLFVRFPPDLPREKLEEYGLQVGYAVLPNGHEEYAEHPYVKGEYRGFDVDCVPCYNLDDATDIRSAVDRTPFHNQYLEGRVDPLADDVRLAKAFLTGIGAYGSNLRTKGFSGFLTELLVWECGGFRAFVEAAAEWNPPVEFDPEDHGTRTFDDPLVFIDPTDPERNVAAVCSERNVARLIHYSRELLADPRTDRFEPPAPDPLDADAVRTYVDERGTTPVAVRFSAPDVVEDQLYPQLDKSLSGIEGALERAGFAPLRSARFADESAVLLVECSVAELAGVCRHDGPPVGARSHAEGFYNTYIHDDSATGPLIDEDGRYVVERRRDARTPTELLETQLFEVSLGPHVESALEAGYDLLSGQEIATMAEEFGAELAAYFEPRP